MTQLVIVPGDRAQDDVRKMHALIKLAALRMTSVPEATQVLLVRELERETAADVEEACQRLGRRPKAEFASAFPDLGTILIEIGEIDGDRRREALRRQPPPPIPTEEEMETFIQQWRVSSRDDIQCEIQRLRDTRETVAAANAADAIASGARLERD